MKTIKQIIDSIKVGDDGNYVIKEKDRLAAIKVLITLEDTYSGKGNEDWHHGITDTLGLLLTLKEYQQWEDTWGSYKI